MSFKDDSPFLYRRIPSRVVMVGSVAVGGNHPIPIQSMTIHDTMDTKAVLEEAISLYHAGCQIVRMTAQGPKEAENLGVIRSELRKRGYHFPLVADIHFSPKAAIIAAQYVEKIRINPGNFADTKRFRRREYSDLEYQNELNRVGSVFLPLVIKAKDLNKSIRIGVNHGSLSDRIMNRYGDTPKGMVESALEFIDFSVHEGFFDLIISMKASNPQVMVSAVRLLIASFQEKGYDFPVHLGVTEAGSKRDGRMKSAVGISSLLMDGIGDTIRVSLTEDPIYEAEAARLILQTSLGSPDLKNELPLDHETHEKYRNRYQKMFPLKGGGLSRFPVREVTLSHFSSSLTIGGNQRHAVFLRLSDNKIDLNENTPQDIRENIQKGSQEEQKRKELLSRLTAGLRLSGEADAVWCSQEEFRLLEDVEDDSVASLPALPCILDMGIWKEELGQEKPCKKDGDTSSYQKASAFHFFLPFQEELRNQSSSTGLLSWIKGMKKPLILGLSVSLRDFPKSLEFLKTSDIFSYELLILSLHVRDVHPIDSHRLFVSHEDIATGSFPPILLQQTYTSPDTAPFEAGSRIGPLLLSGIGDSLLLDVKDYSPLENLQFSLDLLQATRLRSSKTEYISCPSCGRTLFDIEEVTHRIQEKTSHLKGVKIAVMGCIVNGPGEMADADFGYVGAGHGKIHLYRQKDLVRSNISEERAVDELIGLIRESGCWIEPPKEKLVESLYLT